MRIDQLLVERRLASSRAQAQRLIAAGVRWRAAAGAGLPWRQVNKNGDELPDGAEIELLDTAEARYVSRGGLKLEGALLASGVSVQGKNCLDVGQSTGGFTDCLLQQGALRVVGVDVGQGQLHARLRADPRVLCVESVNARALTAQDLAGDAAARDGADEGVDRREADEADDDEALVAPAEALAPVFDLVVADLSFISLTLVLPALVPFLAPAGDMLLLVKPQFELQPGQVGKGGIVKDPALYAAAEARLRACCAGLGLAVISWFDSPISGGDGNREFFVHATRSTGS